MSEADKPKERTPLDVEIDRLELMSLSAVIPALAQMWAERARKKREERTEKEKKK